MTDGKIIQSVSKAMMLLDILSQEDEPITLAQISQKTGWPKSTVHGLLSTMREYSVIYQDSEGRYSLGIRLFEYGCKLASSWDIVDRVKPFIQHISYSTGEAVFLSILDHGEVITLDRLDDRIGLLISPEMGCRLPVHCTSQGKLFLAYMPEAERNEILRRSELKCFTEHTITSMPELMNELHRIQERGYAVENSEYKTGLRSIAAPIVGEHGEVKYAVGVIGMFRQIESDQFSKAVQIVTETAKQISRTF